MDFPLVLYASPDSAPPTTSRNNPFPPPIRDDNNMNTCKSKTHLDSTMDFPLVLYASPDSAPPTASTSRNSSGNNPLPPPKRDQFTVPKDVTEGSASRTITTWKKLHEINLLKSILEYYNENGTYPFDDPAHMKKFYKWWIEDRVYIDEDVFNNKMIELPERFYKNQDKTFVLGKKLKAWMPPADVRIYELSSMIWGNIGDDEFDDFDDVDEVDDNEDDGGSLVDPKD